MLASSPRELCSKCHDAKSAILNSKHRNVKLATADCTACHDPHGSGKPKLLAAFPHKPYGEGHCDACHTADSSLKTEVPGLCTSCHANHAQDAAKPAPHPAVTQGDACLNCHSPHAGRTSSLLAKGDMKATCLTCHDRAQFERPVKHPDQENCDTCHQVHGGDQEHLLQDKQSSLCLTCHDVTKTHTHPIQGPAKDPRDGKELRCTSCHNPHSSTEEHLLAKEKKRALCVQCHVGPNLEVRGRSGS